MTIFRAQANRKKLKIKALLFYVGLFVSALCLTLAYQPAVASVHQILRSVEPTALEAIAPVSKDAIETFTKDSIEESHPLAQGRMLYTQGQFSQAVAVLQPAIEALQLQGDAIGHAEGSTYLSLAYQKLGKWSEAEQALDQGLAALTSPGQERANTTVLAKIFNAQGSLKLAMGQPEAALAAWERSEKTYAHLGDDLGQLGSQINQVQALQILGFYRRAQDRLEHANSQLQRQPNSELKALGLRSLGSILQVIGDLKQSQKVLEQSFELANQLDPPLNPSQTLFALGNTSRALQETDQALTFYRRAADTAPASIERIRSQLNQLSLLIETEQWPEAQALIVDIQPQWATLTPSRQSIYAQVNFAASVMKMVKRQGNTSHVDVFDPHAIAQLLSRAVQQARDLNDQKAESYALGHLSALYEQTQQWDAAQELIQQALLLAETTHSPDIIYRWEWQLGRILKARDNGEVSSTMRDAYLKSFKTLKSIRRDLLTTNPESQFSFREEVEPVYRELVELLIQPSASPDDLQLAREVMEDLQLARLENFFRSACVVPSKQIDFVDDKAAILYPILLPDQLVVILSLPGQPLSYRTTPVPLTQVETLVKDLRRNLILPYTSPTQDIQPLSQQLYTWMIQPLEGLLSSSDVETLVFELDGVLNNIPISVLHDGEQYLIEKYNIALTPSLQIFEPRPLAQIPLRALTAGLTEARDNFAPLEFVEDELNKINTEISSEILLNQDFTTTALANELDSADFPIVHIATHGQFSSQSEETFILAWDQEITINKLERLLETRELDSAHQIELLVLSACETADGDQRASLGLAGVAVRAGARSTLASLWFVDDESTALFMGKFYQELKQGLPKAEALRLARLSLLKGRYQHPRFWAPFVLLGNWL